MFFASCEKHTQTEEFLEMNPGEATNEKDGYKDIFKVPKEILQRGKMSISSVETIGSYASKGRSSEGVEDGKRSASQFVTPEVSTSEVITADVSMSEVIAANVSTSEVISSEASTSEVIASEDVTPEKSTSDFTPNRRGAVDGTISSEGSDNVNVTSGSGWLSGNIPFKDSYKSMTGERRVCRKSIDMWTNMTHISNDVCQSNSSEGKISVDQSKEKKEQQNAKMNCHDEMGRSHGDANHDEEINDESNTAQCANVDDEMRDRYYTSNSKDDSKKVIISSTKNMCKNNIDNFKYLNGILEKTYEEYINFNGSEYIYIYDICIKSEDIQRGGGGGGGGGGGRRQDNEVSDDKGCDRRDALLILNVYNLYINIFHNFTNKINKVRKLFSPVEINHMEDTHTSGVVPSITEGASTRLNQCTNILRGEEVIWGKDIFGRGKRVGTEDTTIFNNTHCDESPPELLPTWGTNDKEKNQRNRRDPIHNCLNSNNDTVKYLINEEKQLEKNLNKKKFMEKLNYMFFTAINIKSNDDSISTTGGSGSSESVSKNDIAISKDLEGIPMDKVKHNMMVNINRRIYQTDIYDIEIIKKGYTYLYMQKGEWKYYFCVFFILKSSTRYKNDIIFKHYCKVYERDYILSILKYDDMYTNHFLAFFEDKNFEKKKKKNFELSMHIRKNLYKIVIEISKEKKPELIHNSHYININDTTKTNNYLRFYDIYGTPYYIAPLEFTPIHYPNCDLQMKNDRDDMGLHLEQAHLRHSHVKLWKDCIHNAMEKMVNGNNSTCECKVENGKTIYVNKKLSQWLEAFKEERNIRGSPKRICS
ncbi:conserved Plasmodium protein, unknown function [Plasmodium ovale]|uniref:Uncharacterized protein n=1 Tax=Plasmodium ovale TaxID=36330 RepID=A0A1C3KUC8_PLAOA|nr:conserved Plasmodium protein, unknown function [Plasmodium ovale]